MSSIALDEIKALATWLSLFCMSAVGLGCLSAIAAAWAARWFVRRPPAATSASWPDVSILKPLFGIEAQLSETIETYLNQDYEGHVQIVFGVQDPDDGAIPVVKSLIQRYPGLDLRLVVDGAMHGGNRKVSNLINMARVARHPLIVMADSDIAVGPQLFAHVGGRAGAAGRRGGHLPLSRRAERRLLVATFAPWRWMIISCPA